MKRAVFLIVAATGCSAADGPASDRPSAGPDQGQDGGPASGDAAPLPVTDSGPDAGPAPDSGGGLAPVRFKIQVDYRFDKAGFFADPVRKQSLEGACRMWGRLLSDAYPTVPKGTYVITRDPEKPTLPAQPLTIEYDIDDLLIFVGSSDLAGNATGLSAPTAGLSGVADAQLRAALDARFNGAFFQPWTAWISFDSAVAFHFEPAPDAPSPAPVPSNKIDFASVALHEIGHVLGFGTAPAFASKVTGGAFAGPKTQAVFGGALPLTSDGAHVPSGTMSGGAKMLMDPSDSPGTRAHVTPADQAVLEDLGHAF